MIYTNLYQLPGPLASLIKEDLYYAKRKEQLEVYAAKHGLTDYIHYSVSDLIKPPRMRILTSRYWDQIVEDVSASIFRLLGTAIHTVLRMSGKRDDSYICEERLFTHMTLFDRVFIISGEPDLVTPEGEVHDYKVTGLFSWNKGVKVEWEQQTNCYAWLRSKAGLKTTALKICFILRDWMQSKTVQEDYPKAGAQMMDVELWPDYKTECYIIQRVKEHFESMDKFDDELPECTPDEMWEKPEAWALQRVGSTRASKLYRAEAVGKDVAIAAATAAMELKNKTIGKKEKPYEVEHRPGERTRCQSFCSARSFCSQWKEYTGAAFGGR